MAVKFTVVLGRTMWTWTGSSERVGPAVLVSPATNHPFGRPGLLSSDVASLDRHAT